MDSPEQGKKETGPGVVIEPTFAEGKPAEIDRWRQKIGNRERMMKYLATGERYWYGESYGSERRKTKA